MPPRKKILILGASYAGISTAHYLLKHVFPLLQPDTYQIVLVNPSLETMCRPACPRALISDTMFPQDKIFVNIPALFEQYPNNHFTFIHGKAVKLDHNKCFVTLHVIGESDLQQHTFDALIIATGASTVSPLLGVTKDSEFLRASWAEFREALPHAKSIIVAGGGPSGIETAGELGEYLNGRGVSKKGGTARVAITVLTSSSKILPVLSSHIAKRAESMLADVGVTIVKGTKVVNVSPSEAGIERVAANAIITLNDGTTLVADLYIPAVGLVYNTGFADDALLDASGRIETNSATLRVDKAGAQVYAIGDVSSAARPAIHNVFAQVPVLCENIKHDLLGITNSSTEKIFNEDKRVTQLVPIGKNKGVGAVMGWNLPSVIVWLIKGRDYWLWTTGGLWSGKQWNKAG